MDPPARYQVWEEETRQWTPPVSISTLERHFREKRGVKAMGTEMTWRSKENKRQRQANAVLR